MTDTELIQLINSISDEKIKSIESIDAVSKPGAIVVVGLSGVKLIEFTLTESGDFSYKFKGTKLIDLSKGLQ